MKIQVWDKQTAELELRKRLNYAADARKRHEEQWRLNEITIYNASSPFADQANQMSAGPTDVDDPAAELNVNYVFKNIKFLHAQMSANPPVVQVRPATSDQEDRRKALAADQIIQHGLRVYDITEVVDRVSLDTLTYGNGFIKTIWNPHKGEILSRNPESGEVTLEGDTDITSPNLWNIFPDADAETYADCKYVFERRYIPYVDALAKWPNLEEKLQNNRIKYPDNVTTRNNSAVERPQYDSVEVYEYWETGLPINGYLGRFALCLKDGTMLTDILPNPFAFVESGQASKLQKAKLPPAIKDKKISELPKVARLPYVLLTEVDVNHSMWGKSLVEWAAPLQAVLNSLDTMKIDNIATCGSLHLVLPEGAEIADDSLGNTPREVVKMTGVQPPHFMSAPQMMPDIAAQREQVRQDIDAIMGLNEAMQGVQSRETSGASMEFSVNQGNMVRRRLFNKYRTFTEHLYKNYLDVIRDKWDIERTIRVVGKEKVVHAVDYKGSDIDGGFDIFVEYGTSLSLDPQTRRNEMIQYFPILEKAGLSPRQFLKYMKLNELDNVYDSLEMAENRQREIFEAMINDPSRFIAPRLYEDHPNMLIYAKQWVMSREFTDLPENVKLLCEQHMTQRIQMEAQQSLAAQSGVPGGAPPQGGVPGALPPNADLGAAPATATTANAPAINPGA